MNFDIGFTDFRGFHVQKCVPVRPLTILVGENSSGKSSFLAGIKYAHEFLGKSVDPSFNGDPFQLGTFAQIAHNRGGRAGRAREFIIELRKETQENREANVAGNDRSNSFCRISFGAIESTAAITSLEFEVGAQNLTLSPNQGVWEFTDTKGKAHDLKDYLRITGFPQSENIRFLTFVMSNLSHFDMRYSGDDGTTRITEFKDFSRQIDKFLELFSGELVASSAIRTKPLRTYTPGLESENSEGSHVPFELAKLARKRNKSDWQAMKNQLTKFGIASDMFDTIDVKSFGKSVSDPFQVQFSSSGPKMNIVDLGYGNSQVLPILFDSSNRGGDINFLIQQPEVHLHPKAQAALGEFFIDAYLRRGQNFILETHSDFILDRVRLAVSNKLINAEDVSILFFERGRLENEIHSVALDTNGEPASPPQKYREFFQREQMHILGVS